MIEFVLLCFRTFLAEDSELEFSIHFVIQALGAKSILIIFAAFSWCCIGLCTYLYAVVDDFEAVANNLVLDEKSRARNVNTTNILCELIQLHSNILR